MPEGGTGITVRITDRQRIQGFRIGPDHIADIRFVFQPALYLEGADAGLGQFLQPVDEPVVFQGQQGLVAYQHLPRGILQVVQAAAGLGAGSPVGAPAGEVLRQIALSAVTHAQRSVNEDFDLRMDGLADGADLRQGKFPLQHQPAKAQAFQAPGLVGRPDGALGRGVHHQFITHREHGGVLHDQGVHAGLFQGLDQLPCPGKFFFLQKCIHRGENTDPEAMGVGTQAGDVLHGIAGGLTGPERRAGDVHGIGPAVDGRDADFRRPGRSQQFQGSHTDKYTNYSGIISVPGPVLRRRSALSVRCIF